jgi:hypothetical protein
MTSQQVELPAFTTRVFRRIGSATGLSLLLLLVCLASIAYGLTLVVRGLSPELALGLAGAGLGTGWLLARSPLKAIWSASLAVLFGVTGLFLHLGGLLPDLFRLLQHINQLGVGLVRDPFNGDRRLNQARLALEAGGDLWDKLL